MSPPGTHNTPNVVKDEPQSRTEAPKDKKMDESCADGSDATNTSRQESLPAVEPPNLGQHTKNIDQKEQNSKNKGSPTSGDNTAMMIAQRIDAHDSTKETDIPNKRTNSSCHKRDEKSAAAAPVLSAAAPVVASASSALAASPGTAASGDGNAVSKTASPATSNVSVPLAKAEKSSAAPSSVPSQQIVAAPPSAGRSTGNVVPPNKHPVKSSSKPVCPTTQHPAKKRKLLTTFPSSLPAPTRPTAAIAPLADYPAVEQCVNNILALLQTYGPLSYEQLEYNLPPLNGTRLNQKSLFDILDILLATEIVQKVKEPSSPARFCIFHGATRADVILPTNVVDQIINALHEINRSRQRTRRLREALLSSANPREAVKSILLEFPEVGQDPVYVAALRNLHIDVGAVDRRSGKRSGAASRDRAKSKSADPHKSAAPKAAAAASSVSSLLKIAKAADASTATRPETKVSTSRPATTAGNNKQQVLSAVEPKAAAETTGKSTIQPEQKTTEPVTKTAPTQANIQNH